MEISEAIRNSESEWASVQILKSTACRAEFYNVLRMQKQEAARNSGNTKSDGSSTNLSKQYQDLYNRTANLSHKFGKNRLEYRKMCKELKELEKKLLLCSSDNELSVM